MAEGRFARCSEGALVGGFVGCRCRPKTRNRAETVERWLERSRRATESKYGPFAEAVDTARAERALPPPDERPVEPDELRVLVSKVAKKGNVQAQRLLWEMLQTDPAEKRPGDLLDELEAKRRSRG
jgi:hypothetical protein